MTDLVSVLEHPEKIARLDDDELAALLGDVLRAQQEDRREMQIRLFRPTSELAWRAFRSEARVIGIGGGNGSGKTETMIVRMVALATGVFPDCLREELKRDFRGPISCRLVVESLTTVLEPTILPKLMWWRWNGLAPQGGEKGHWGWVPRECLKGGSWEKAYSQKLRILTLLCRDPENYEQVLGESTIQFMSKDQDATDFASGDFHFIGHDEPPPLAIWRENEARTMRVAGKLMLAMTWPDDPSFPVDWIHDEIYEKGKAGEPGFEWIELDTRLNPHLDQRAIAEQEKAWDAVTRAVRLSGQPIRFSNRIHPLFTDREQTWCFACGSLTFAVEAEDLYGGGRLRRCQMCNSSEIADFNHVGAWEVERTWPCIHVLDPHPRKPHMWLWVQIRPDDDLVVVAEGKLDSEPLDVRTAVEEEESALGLKVVLRLMDPNMGRSPASARHREQTWQDAFEECGLRFDLASDSAVGRQIVNEYLKPDPGTWRPRLLVDERCRDTIYQLKRYTWEDYKRAQEKDLKEVPRQKYDDYPTMLKYVANAQPSFAVLNHGPQVLQRPGTRRGAY